MDIYNYLKKDHQKVSKLFDQLLASNGKKQRQDLFDKLKQELLVHAQTENATFYQALHNSKSKTVTKEIDHAQDEHAEIKAYINKITRLEIGTKEWLEKIGEFRHAVLHHVKEEEGEIFDQAKKILSLSHAKKLAMEMDNLKQESQRQADDSLIEKTIEQIGDWSEKLDNSAQKLVKKTKKQAEKFGRKIGDSAKIVTNKLENQAHELGDKLIKSKDYVVHKVDDLVHKVK